MATIVTRSGKGSPLTNTEVDANFTNLNTDKIETNAEVRAAVEAASDSNVFTDADHTKLNAIEAGATADQTAAEILTAIKTVDGAGSGLDADTLDGVEAAALLPLSGGTMTGNLAMSGANITLGTSGSGSDDRIALGASAHGQIYHDGTNFLIQETGSGNLLIDGTNVSFRSAAAENYISCVADGAVSLYHNNSTKLATTSGGVHVTGNLSAATKMTVQSASGTEGVSLFYNENGGEIQLLDTNGNTGLLIDYLDNDDNSQGLVRFLQLSAGSEGVQVGIANASNTGGVTFTTGNNVTRQHINAIGDIFNYATDGSTVGMFWDASETALNFSDNSKATFGAGSDLQIYHAGTGSVISDVGTGNLYIDSTNLNFRNAGTNKTYAVMNDGGAVSLYHDNAKMFETTSYGTLFTGNSKWVDNGKATFGAGDDLQIYHDGSHSYVDDTADGNLYLRSNGAGVIVETVAGQTMARFLNGNACDFNFGSTTRLATTATGATITGAVKSTTYQETYVAKSAASTVTCDLATGTSFSLTMDQNTTFAFTNPPSSGTAFSFTLFITQHSTAVTLTWPGTVDWAGGSAPDAAGNNEVQAYGFFTRDGGTTYYGFLGGSALG